jgi:hypothetical protein
MTRTRYEDDDQYRPLQKWETRVDAAIRAARERGEFDNLPGHGKPLALPDNPFAGGLEVGFGVLKNAGVAPYWIEVDKEIRAELSALSDLRESATQRVATLLAGDPAADQCATTAESGARGRWPFRRWAPSDATGPRPRVATAVVEREQARREYLERAAELDEKIAHYNASLPRDLWRLERPRPTMDQHARDFDAGCPPIATTNGPRLSAGGRAGR